MKKTRYRLAFVLWLLCLSWQAVPQAASLTDGMEAGFIYTQDYFRNLDGGLQRGGAAPGTLDLYASLDSSAWGGDGNLMLHLDLLGTLGGSVSALAGDLQTLDNIEAPNTFKVFEAWLQYNLDGGWMLRLGLQDYNALFNTLDAAGVLLNSSFGLDPSIAQAEVATFPVSAPGAVLRWRGGNAYVMAAVFDGVPGLPGHPHGTQIHFLPGEGVFAAVETGLTGGVDRPWKLALGGWYRSSRFTDVSGAARSRNHGGYLIAQARLLQRGGVSVDGFLQLGLARASRNPLDQYLGAGLLVRGLVPARPDDAVSLGLARAHTSSRYRAATPGSSGAETALELTWQAVLNEHLILQPDIQYILDPGAQAAVRNAWLLGIRAELSW